MLTNPTTHHTPHTDAEKARSATRLVVPGSARGRRNSRNRHGAVMMETVMILPIIMVVLVLMVYLGWNVRRLQKVTNIDRYVAWEEAMPGTPGPSRNRETGHADLNRTFYTLDNDDTAITITDSSRAGRGPIYEAYELLLTQLSEEEFAYFQNLLEDNPSTIYQRFEAEHDDINQMLSNMGMSNLTRNSTGHLVRNGDWRYADGITLDRSSDEWIPGSRRITPSPSLADVFFAQFDEEIAPLVNGNNPLAQATRDFYRAYPAYRGPNIETD